MAIIHRVGRAVKREDAVYYLQTLDLLSDGSPESWQLRTDTDKDPCLYCIPSLFRKYEALCLRLGSVGGKFHSWEILI